MDKNITYEKIKNAYVASGFAFYESPYNINLFGIRDKSDKVNAFNDILGVAYIDDLGNEVCLVASGTTKPGSYWVAKRMGNVDGTAILVPGNYKSCLVIGRHRGQYEALVQSDKAEFKVWRDYDMDGAMDYSGNVYSNVMGLNMHTTSVTRKIIRVGQYSAGCQVRQSPGEHFIMMEIAKESTKRYGDYLSYTLFDEDEIVTAPKNSIWRFPFWWW